MIAASQISDKARWQAFAVAASVSALTTLDLTKLNVGLPSIQASLGAASTDLQILIAGYALAFGLVLVPAGRLGDQSSRKNLFIVGLSGFIVASLACAAAPNTEVLVVARTVQGIAAGTLMPQVLGLTQQLFVGPARGKAFGMFGAIVGVSTALAPTLGGVLIAIGGPEEGWRLLFAINIPLGILALVFAIRLLPVGSPSPEGRKDLDPAGVLLLGLATFGLLFPFVITSGLPSDSPARWLWLLLFAGAGIGFVLWERYYSRRGRSPLVHFDLFRIRSYSNGLLVGTFYFAALPAIFLISTLFLQEGLGLDPLHAGLVSIPFALASAVTAWIGGRLVNRFGRVLVVGGLTVVVIGYCLDLAFAVLLPASVAPWAMAGALLIAGAGGGFVISPNQTLTLAEIDTRSAGTAGSMAQLGQRIGTSIGVAAASSTFFSAVLAHEDHGTSLAAFRFGFRNGVAVALSLMLVALAAAIWDLLRRRRVATELNQK